MRLLVCFLIKRPYKNFCLQEYETLCKIFNTEVKYLTDLTNFDVMECPFVEVDLPDYETATKIAHRSVMVSHSLNMGLGYQSIRWW